MGTHHKGTPREVRALDAFIKLVRASQSVSSRLQAGRSEHGLTESQFGILEALYHLGPLCQTALGSKILRSGGNVTLVVDNLEKRGLVRRVRDPDDRRYVSVQLTDEGRALIAGIFPSHAAEVAEVFGALTASEQQELARLCKKLGKAAGSDEGPTSR